MAERGNWKARMSRLLSGDGQGAGDRPTAPAQASEVPLASSTPLPLGAYPSFRVWIVERITLGATPHQVAAWLQRYRTKHLTTAPLGWADGQPEVPTEAEILHLGEKSSW